MRTPPDSTPSPTEPQARASRAWLGLQGPAERPLRTPFVAGLGPLLRGLAEGIGGVLVGPKARAVIRAVGDRYTVTVSEDGVTSRGLIRRHTAAWSDAEAVELEQVASMATKKVVGRTASKLLGRSLPIPGLSWLAGKVIDKLTAPIAAVAAGVTPGLPDVLVAVRTRQGDGIRLEGPLALTSVLSQGLTATAVAEAEERGIPVERTTD